MIRVPVSLHVLKAEGAREQSRLDVFSSHWKKCHLCTIGTYATRHVIGRGTLPATILFIGEAPGPDEDKAGAPFVGRSGYVLQSIIDVARVDSYAITNTVCCQPTDRAGGHFRIPLLTEVENCSTRLIQFITKFARPTGIVLVGRVAAEHTVYLAATYGTNRILDIYHPSYILRTGGMRSSPHYQPTVDAVANFYAAMQKEQARVQQQLDSEKRAESQSKYPPSRKVDPRALASIPPARGGGRTREELQQALRPVDGGD